MIATVALSAVQQCEVEVCSAVGEISEYFGLIRYICAMSAIWTISNNEKGFFEAVSDNSILVPRIEKPIFARTEK